MDTTPAAAPAAPSKTTPRDFFLWLGGIIALYGSITSLITLKFEYIDHLFPDALTSYVDPYGGPIRTAMAALIVLAPTMVVLFWLIRRSITAESGKANIWVRRWALVFTLFLAVVTMLIDLVTLINTFLGGEITTRFALKVLVVLVVAAATFLYFFFDLKGYWVRHALYARIIGAVVILGAFATVAAGFFVIGSPNHIRDLKLDAQRIEDISLIQGSIGDYYRSTKTTPDSVDALESAGFLSTIPTDPETNAPYEYQKTGDLTFTLCATFGANSEGRDGQGVTYPVYPTNDIGSPVIGNDWSHAPGHVCFDRTINPKAPTADQIK